jgi:dipeptidase E
MFFLSGGGSAFQTELLDRAFFKVAKKILYIPIGHRKTFSGYEGCYNWFCNLTNYHSFDRNSFDLVLNLNRVTKDIELYDSIYIAGAESVSYLLKAFIDSGFDKKLNNFILNGGRVYGGSAGAIILGRSIDTYYDNIEKGKGLSILPFSVLSNYPETEDSRIIINSYPTIALRPNCGIVYINRTIHSIGYDEVICYLSPHEKIYLKLGEKITI